jgi:putative transposase
VLDWLRGGAMKGDQKQKRIDPALSQDPSDGNEPIEYLEGIKGYTDYLAENGYVCGLSGKWHLGHSVKPQKSFDMWFPCGSGMTSLICPTDGETISSSIKSRLMKQKQHSTEEIIRILRQAETDATIDSVCREHNVSKATFHRWKRKYGDMDLADAKRFKELEKENVERKKMLAESLLKNRVLEEVNAKKW